MSVYYFNGFVAMTGFLKENKKKWTKVNEPGNTNVYILPLCVIGIYTSFLTWALVQEPLNTKVWINSNEKFQCPNIIAVCQAAVAMTVGYIYLKWQKNKYDPLDLIKDHFKQLILISFTQSTSTPLATYALNYVDYLTYMLAKSCKMIPVLLIHLLIYRSYIDKEKKIVAMLVTLGVIIFTIGGNKRTKKISFTNSDPNNIDQFNLGISPVWFGFVLLLTSLFLDGLTNATQDKLLKNGNKEPKDDVDKNNSKNHSKVNNKGDKKITGAHLMFALNMFIILWNLPYLGIFHRTQFNKATTLIQLDPQIGLYLLAYSLCGAVGQCFIFFTLEKYGSLVLIMITVTRKMISMLLSIIVFNKKVNVIQWFGICIVFGGIFWEALNKRRSIISNKSSNSRTNIDKKLR